MQPLVVAIAQFAPLVGDLEGNAQRVKELVDRSAQARARMLFLPEACLTGYSRERASECAIDFTTAVGVVEKVARDAGVAVSFGFIERDPQGGKPFVTHVIWDDGVRLVYRKTHLGPHEQNAFQLGESLMVGSVAGAYVGVQLCWEGHIPQVAATLRARGVEVIAAPFASGVGGAARLASWAKFLPARASDNGVYVVACNALSAALDGTMRGGGMAVYDPKGNVLVDYAGSDEALIVCDLDGVLPRNDTSQPMSGLSYFDYQRPELYK